MADPKLKTTKKSSKASEWLKYSGIVTQLAGLLFVGIWLGGKIDEYFEFEKPIFAALLMLLFMLGFFYKLIRDLSQKSK